MHSPARLPRALILCLTLVWAGLPAAAGTPVPWSSEEAFLAALTGEPTFENFDGFESPTVLTDQIPGLVLSSPNMEHPGYNPLQAVAYSFAASAPNVLDGGEVPGSSTVRQAIIMDFDPTITAFAFQLGAYHPDGADLEVRIEFTDESTASLFTRNPTDDEAANVFFGFTADAPVFRVTLISGIEGGGYEEFVVDDLIFGVAAEVSDTHPPVCSGDPFVGDGAFIQGSATDSAPGDSGIASIALDEGSFNLTLSVDPDFEPGASSTTFLVSPTDGGMDAGGTVVVTDLEGFECRLPADFRTVDEGPLTDEVLCDGEGILLVITNGEETPAGTAACASEVPSGDDPAFPPGYEASAAEDPFPCRILTVDSPIAGDTEMVYKKDGDFDPRLRLLFSRSADGGLTFPPFDDITESVIPILTVVPDPTRLSGKKQWSPVKIACAVQAEICDGADNDLDGEIDEGLPAGGPDVDADLDGAPLCAPEAADADCNDRIAAIHPGAAEACNGLDDDCDTVIDEDDPGGGAACVVPGVLGACAEGLTTCFEGALHCEQVNFPAATEVCDGRDEDCDGLTDENYVFGGYRPPVNADGSSIFRRGSVAPLKFRLAGCSGAPVPDAVATVEIFFYAAGVVGTEIEEVASTAASNTDNLYRYDAAEDQYLYNLDTNPLAPMTSYLIRTTLDDGTSHDVVISIK